MARLLLGGIFLLAAWAKVRNPTLFAEAVGGFRLLPAGLLLPAALWIIWLEIVGGTALVIGLWPRAAAALAGGMLIVFFLALASALARGLAVECGCFGALMAGGITTWALLRTLGLLALAILVYRRE